MVLVVCQIRAPDLLMTSINSVIRLMNRRLTISNIQRNIIVKLNTPFRLASVSNPLRGLPIFVAIYDNAFAELIKIPADTITNEKINFPSNRPHDHVILSVTPNQESQNR